MSATLQRPGPGAAIYPVQQDIDGKMLMIFRLLRNEQAKVAPPKEIEVLMVMNLNPDGSKFGSEISMVLKLLLAMK